MEAAILASMSRAEIKKIANLQNKDELFSIKNSKFSLYAMKGI